MARPSALLRIAGLIVGAALVITGCGGNSGDSAHATSTPASAPAAAGRTDDAPAPTPGALPRIAILATGGTIAGKANANSAVGYTAGEATAQDLIDAVPGLDKIAKLSAEQISNIGSQDMNDEVWVELAHRINELFDRNEVDGVVVTHGTDTIEETAFFLDNVVASDKPVVLVGSMRPSTALSADGPANLRSAVQVAAAPAARGRGTMVVLNDTIHGAADVTKTSTTSVQTFVSPNTGPVGHVDAAAVTFLQPAAQQRHSHFPVPGGTPLPRVDIVYSHAGMNADQVNDAVGHGAKGIVLAGVGDGNTAKPVVDALSKAAKGGVVVVRSSRVGSGETVRNAELNDDELGTSASLYLNPAKSRVLVQLLLANGITDPANVQREFADRL
ncbi:type II asparaginase [Nocardia sp. CDC153]|uniref:type II asparaginase n=1 Tax=Nocardia sp. CDC153 TaxID=3112167 RepID=UPI002DBA3108|nr:type II asparaginase [Nocardia sp. CDC153]MEC3954170.1 type II asparaginase [Nocardia sp. CDC153]